MGTDYYKLLGIDKSASDEEVKKAYKKMVSTVSSRFVRTPGLTVFKALKWHPDRNGGSEDASKKFKEVSHVQRCIDGLFAHIRLLDLRGLRSAERQKQTHSIRPIW